MLHCVTEVQYCARRLLVHVVCTRAYAIPFYIDDVTDRHIRKRTLSFRKRTFLTLSLVFVFELMLAVVIPFCQVTCLFKINSCKETVRYRMGHHILLTFPSSTSRNVSAGTELTWDYAYEVDSVKGKVLHCYCGSAECRGRLLWVHCLLGQRRNAMKSCRQVQVGSVTDIRKQRELWPYMRGHITPLDC